MKKIKYFLLPLLLFLIINVNAVELKERTEENNYGVSKKWEMNSEKYEYAKKTPYVDAAEKIYDFSDILTDEEEKELKSKIDELIEKYHMEVIILTYDYAYSEDSDNSYFASDFYDFNDFGLDFDNYSGVLLFRNTYESNPYYDMFSFGKAQLKYYDSRMSDILDDIYNDIHSKNYLEGFNKWLTDVDSYGNYEELENYNLDEMGHLVKIRKFNPLILGNLLISSIITIIYITINVKKNKMVKLATQASTYLNKQTFKLQEESDKLVHSHVSSYVEPEPTSSSSGGGSHSSFSGHSGGGFSSGGGRHG